MWLQHLIRNHVLTNLVFALVIVMGFIVYQDLPREQDPSINFNWVQVTTFLPGASAKDMEEKVTDIIEESIERIQDIKFVSSSSREGISSILIRFYDMDQYVFDKRLADLRREINSIEGQLPIEIDRPIITEITSANAFPTATVVLSSIDDDENLRAQARALEKDLARIAGVDRVMPIGQRESELQIQFDTDKLESLSLSPVNIADSIRQFYKDISAGSVRIAQDQWLVRMEGPYTDPEQLAQLPILVKTNTNVNSEIRIGDVAKVVKARAKENLLVRFQGKPAVMFSIMKQESANTLKLVEKIDAFITQRQILSAQLGVEFTLVDDQTLITRNALSIMQTNALVGLLFVLLVTWLFLGTRISLLVTIGIPFTLAGTFIALQLLGQTLNTSVLLAIVISLGMLVDDAVVVVESIYARLQNGIKGIEASWGGLLEVIKPVSASVLTTMAAFLPLMLLPGILGKFMMVIPLVVTIALAVSLVEAYWMLPGHIMSAKVNFDKPSKVELIRKKAIKTIKIHYGRWLIKFLRSPKKTLTTLIILLALAISAVAGGVIRTDFFAADTVRLFYINVEMPTTSSLDKTMKKVLEVETKIQAKLESVETRSVVSYSGQMFTEMEPLFGDHLGQVMVSLKPATEDMRTVEEIVEAAREDVQAVIGPVNISFLTLAGGPPVSKPISVKVRGDDYQQLREAADELKLFLDQDKDKRFVDISDDDSKGRFGLDLNLNLDAINRFGIRPDEVQRAVKMLVDGEIVRFIQHKGDRVAIRVKSLSAVKNDFADIDELLNVNLASPSGSAVPLRELLDIKVVQVKGKLRHYNFKRTISIEANIDKSQTDTVMANDLLKAHWASIASKYPNTSLDVSGVLDDIEESIDAIAVLFLFGVGLMYLILATQFQSYFQPLMILMTVPMAFIGVVLGLAVSNNPLSLFTMYGIVALFGIAVNSSIVLISTANANFNKGMSLLHAVFYAGRRRILPIMITTLTTVAGLFSLATGVGGHSLVWSPVATSIVWGLMFSSVLTLFAVPVLYQAAMKGVEKKRKLSHEKVILGE